MRRIILLLVDICLLLTASCTVAPPANRNWTYADLRLLDPLDASTPSTDILAVYIRTAGSDIEIRIDLLDIPLTPDYNLQILLDTLPGGTPWDITIDIPASGAPTVTPTDARLMPHLARDPWLDTVTLRLNRLYLPDTFTLQVRSFAPGATTPADQTTSVRSDDQPPLTRAPLLLTFWDAFPAVTPAQALRRWDGAHTGPTGERHGLKHILDGAEQYGVPLTLLDLKNPASLAALDYMGKTEQLRHLTKRGLLLLPDVASGEPAQVSLDFCHRAATGFGLSASQFVYAAGADLQTTYPAQFVSLPDTSHLSSSQGTRLVPIPSSDAVQATEDGLALDVRRALMETAFSPDPADLVVLGGSLPASTWGDSDMASPSFAWIAAHPWIWALNGDDLLTFPIGAIDHPSLPAALATSAPIFNSSGGLTGLNSAMLQSRLLADLHNASDNLAIESAWLSYLTLTVPTSDPNLAALRAQYLGQVGVLLAASRWAEHPSGQADCDNDLDYDSQAECVLANNQYFAIIEQDGARLTHLFYLNETGPHQLVAPSSQFSVGLSDPSEWHPERGEAGDPSVIAGAFSDSTDTWSHYNDDTTTNSITLATLNQTLIKTFRLTESGLEIVYQTNGPASTRIPLVVDPQAFYFSPSDYQAMLSPHSWTWGLAGSSNVEVRTDADLSAQGFSSSFPFLSLAEDPNLDYPAGHYFPFPLSVVTLHADGNFRVQISIK